MTNSPLEERDNPTAWDQLLRTALPALDHVFGQDEALPVGAPPPWTLGGGTALALRIAHRLSDDIDIFVPSRRLKLFTPGMNPAAKAIAAKVQWLGGYLNLLCDTGEIHFLSPILQTEPGFTTETYRGRRIAIETAHEIIVKKIRFRSGTFATCDIFDLAALARVDPDLPHVLTAEVADALPRLRTVIAARREAGKVIDIRPTPAFADLRARAYAEAADLIDRAIGTGVGGWANGHATDPERPTSMRQTGTLISE